MVALSFRTPLVGRGDVLSQRVVYVVYFFLGHDSLQSSTRDESAARG
jgi:hypothetical protein